MGDVVEMGLIDDFFNVLVAIACGECAGLEGEKRGREERLGGEEREREESERPGDCVDEGGWILSVRDGGVGLWIRGAYSLMVML